jgi:hypothetical protein
MQSRRSDFHSVARRIALVAFCVLGVLAQTAFAQLASATLNGTVTDPTGAIIAGARVVLHNVATGVDRTTTTNNVGRYVLIDIVPGTYTLQVSAQGFNTASQPEFTLYVNQTSTMDFKLVVGATQQTVEVEATAAQIESSTAELGTAIATRAVNDLPLNGRNFTQLLALTPGVSPVSVAQNAGGGGGFAGNAIGAFTFPAVNGQRNRSNMFLFDGLVDLGSFIGNYNFEPIVDTIQEFKVQSHNDLAEFGQATGGIVNVVSKPGTNEFHGTAWEYLRNEKLDARNFFIANRNPLRQNQYGIAGGGPMFIPKIYNGKNKTFIFAGWEGYRQRLAAQGLTVTPTPQELNGNFSDVPQQIYNPFSTTPDPAHPGEYLRTPFANNQIPTSLLNPASLLYAKTLFPAPMATGVTGFNLVDNTPTATNQDSWHVRADQVFGQKDTLFFRYSTYNQTVDSSAGYPGALNNIRLSGDNYGAHETHTFGPTAILDVHFGRNNGGNFIGKVFPNVPSGFISSLEQAGFASNFIGAFQGGNGPFVPLISINGYLGTGGNNVQDTRIADTWQFGGDFTKIMGRHTFKAGVDFATNNSQSPIFGADEGFTAYETSNLESPGGTGNAMASFLLGVINNAGKRNVLETEHGGWVDGFYVEDQIKATDRLNVNIGVRYDVTLWPIYGSFKTGSIYVGNLDLNNGTYILAAEPPACSATQGFPCIPGGTLPPKVVVTPNSNHSIYRNDHSNWQPRVGLAYRLFSKTAIRAGYGRFFDNWSSVIQLAQNYEGTWPNVGQLLANNLNHTTVDTSVTDPFHLGSGGVIYPGPTPFNQVQWYMDPLARMPYSDQWNFGIDHQLTQNTVLSLGYVGSHDGRLNWGGYKNIATVPGPGDAAVVASRQPYPYISPTFYDQSVGRSSYEAFEFRLDHKTHAGLTYLVSYTWSKSIDFGCSGWFGAEGCSIQDPYSYKVDRSVSGFDLPQIFSFSAVYQLPFGRGQKFDFGNAFANYVLGNWQLNGILSFTSGVPYDVTVSGDIANTGNTTERANLVLNNTAAPNQSPNLWLNPAAFAVPPNFTFGTLGRNSLRGDWFRNLDMSLFRRFPIHENLGIEFRAEAFNLTNSVVFGNPDSNLNDVNFGVISGTRNTPREIQFAAKVYW